jgi:hypothetical protein
MMKKIFTLLTIAITLTISAQESTLLRLNYNVGDQYLVSMNVSQGEMMRMIFEMNMDIKEIQDTIYNVEMGIKRINMKMSQGGMKMAYDSNLGDDVLDDMGKMMKTQFEPMLAAKIFTKISQRAESLETTVEPNIPGMDQFTNNSGTVVYPKEAVKVGDSWTAKKTEKGIEMKFNYTVKSIEKSIVNVEISGIISQQAEGTISGVMEIERATGNVNSTSIDMIMNVSGQEMLVNIGMTSKKI